MPNQDWADRNHGLNADLAALLPPEVLSIVSNRPGESIIATYAAKTFFRSFFAAFLHPAGGTPCKIVEEERAGRLFP